MPVSRKKVTGAIEITVVISLAVSFYAGLGYLIYNHWRAVFELAGLLTSPFILLTIAVFFALALFAFRTIARVQYGLAEIMFGVVSLASATFGQEINLRTTSIQLAAGMYIIVRGLDNLGQGLRQYPSHPLRPIWDQFYSDHKMRRLRRRIKVYFGGPFRESRVRRREKHLMALRSDLKKTRNR